MKTILATLVTVTTSAMIACAAPEETETIDESEARITSGDGTRFRAFAFDVPQGSERTDSDDAALFRVEADFRSYFGSSCGWFCTAPYGGQLPFNLRPVQGKQHVVVFINRPEVDRRHDLVVKSVSKGNRAKAVMVETCIRPGRGRTSAFAEALVDTSAFLVFVDPPAGRNGLEPCP